MNLNHFVCISINKLFHLFSTNFIFKDAYLGWHQSFFNTNLLPYIFKDNKEAKKNVQNANDVNIE